MKLTILERLKLLLLLPQTGNLVTMRMVRKARQAIEFTDSETAKVELVKYVLAGGKPEDGEAQKFKKPNSPNLGYLPDSDRFFWDEPDAANKYEPRDCRLSEAAKEMVCTLLKGLDTDGKITMDLMSLFDKFIGEPAEDDIPEPIRERLEAVPANGE